MLLGSRSGCVGKPACAAANLNSRCIKLVGPGWRLNIFEFYGSGKDISPTFWYIYVRISGCVLYTAIIPLPTLQDICYPRLLSCNTYNHKYIQWSYSVLCTDFYILFKKKLWLFFFLRVPLYLYQGRLEFYGLRNFESTDCWPQRRFGCSSEIAPWRFLEKKTVGVLVFSHSFSQELVPKKQTRKKTGFVFFFGSKASQL